MFIYVLDTSSLRDLDIHYPMDVFPNIWKKFNSLVEDERVISPNQVSDEITSSHKFLHTWCKEHSSSFKKNIQVSKTALDILQKFPKLAIQNPSTESADPYLIAFAYHIKKNTLTNDTPIILTQETSKKPNASQKKPISTEQKKQMSKKIPDVAKTYGIDSMNLLEFFRNEKWTF